VLMAGPAQALTTRLGAKPVLVTGMSLLVAGCLWYTQISPHGSYPVDLLPGFVAVGIGIPFAFIPITIAALAGVGAEEAGLASGLINTSQQVGGAIGTAVLSTVAFTHADTLFAERATPEEALTGGFTWGFWVAAFIWGAGLVAALVFIRREEVAQPEASELPATQT
jgi:MFS family permease